MIEAKALRIEFPPALFTREMAAYYLGATMTDIDRLRNRGELIAVSHKGENGQGKKVLFRKEELDRYAESLPERAGHRRYESL